MIGSSYPRRMGEDEFEKVEVFWGREGEEGKGEEIKGFLNSAYSVL